MGALVSTLVFRPPSEYTAIKRSEIIWLKTRNGNRIPSLHYKNPNARFTILYSHANSEDLGQNYNFLRVLSHAFVCNIFAYDYSGYGLSRNESSPSEENCYLDIEAAYEHLTNVLSVEPRNIILYGRSLGSGPSCYLAEKVAPYRGVAGLILHSPFLSICRIVVDKSWSLEMDMFCNIDRVQNIRCPTFILHGTDDQIVPISHSISLHELILEKYRYPPFWAKKMGHNNIESDMWRTYREKIQQFMLFVMKRQILSSIIGTRKEQIEENFTTTLQLYDGDDIEMFHVVTPSPSNRNRVNKYWDDDLSQHSMYQNQQKIQLFLCTEKW